MRFLKFILSHSVFISCCAAALCYQTNVLLQLPHDKNIYGFLFFSTLCSYNFYWLLSKFYFAGRANIFSFLKEQFSLVAVFIFSAAGTLFFLLMSEGLFRSAAVGATFTLVYSLPLWPFPFSKRLQKAGFLKTTLLAFTWAYVTTIIPAAGLRDISALSVVVLFFARFSFMLLLCIIFDMRDGSTDKVRGLHSLATDVSKRKLNIMIYTVFVFYLISGSFVRYYVHDSAHMFAFIITGIIVWLVYKQSLKPQSYLFYYFLVDGLMLISALGTYLAAHF